MRIRAFYGAERIKACEKVIKMNRNNCIAGSIIVTAYGAFKILSHNVNLHWKKKKRVHTFNVMLA